MKRKIIKQGHNTLTITLPAKWVEQNGIKAGDEIEIEEENKILKLHKGGSLSISSVVLDIEKFNTLIPRTIHAMYKKGIDEIRIQYSDSKISSKIQKAIREETLGYEIVKQSSNYCLVKCISDPVLNEFDPILRRTFLLLISMADDSLEAIKTKDYESLRNIRFMELTNNRYITVCRRIINKFGLHDYPNPNFIYYVIEELERLADHYKYICDYFLGLTKPIEMTKKTLNLYEETNQIVRDLHTLFYNFEPELADSIAQRRKELVKQSFWLLENGNKKEMIMIHNLSIIFQKVFCLLGIIIAMKV